MSQTELCSECGVEIPDMKHRGYWLQACETCSKTRWLHPWWETNPDGTYKKPVVGKCSRCKVNDATKWYAPSYTDFNRGGRMRPWCQECIVVYLKEMRDSFDEALRRAETPLVT